MSKDKNNIDPNIVQFVDQNKKPENRNAPPTPAQNVNPEIIQFINKTNKK